MPSLGSFLVYNCFGGPKSDLALSPAYTLSTNFLKAPKMLSFPSLENRYGNHIRYWIRIPMFVMFG